MLRIAPVEMTRVSVFSREIKNGDLGRNDNKMDSCSFNLAQDKFRRNDKRTKNPPTEGVGKKDKNPLSTGLWAI